MKSRKTTAGTKHHSKPCKEEPESSAEEEYGRWDGGKEATGGKCPSAGGSGEKPKGEHGNPIFGMRTLYKPLKT